MNDSSELAQAALENARRVGERLRRHELDLAQKMPGEVQGGEALRNAVAAVDRVAQLIQASQAAAKHYHVDP